MASVSSVSSRRQLQNGSRMPARHPTGGVTFIELRYPASMRRTCFPSSVDLNTSRLKSGGTEPFGPGGGDLATWPSAQQITSPGSETSVNAAIGTPLYSFAPASHAASSAGEPCATVRATLVVGGAGRDVVGEVDLAEAWLHAVTSRPTARA